MEGIKGSPPPTLHQAGICRPAAHEFAPLLHDVRQIPLERRRLTETVVVIGGGGGRIAQEGNSRRHRLRWGQKAGSRQEEDSRQDSSTIHELGQKTGQQGNGDTEKLMVPTKGSSRRPEKSSLACRKGGS